MFCLGLHGIEHKVDDGDKSNEAEDDTNDNTSILVISNLVTESSVIEDLLRTASGSGSRQTSGGGRRCHGHQGAQDQED